MSLQEMMKNTEKITLKNPMTLEELYNFLKPREAEFPGKFKLSKGLFGLGKGIIFDTFMQIEPRVTVDDNVVTIKKMTNNTSVSVGGSPAVNLKSLKQMAGAVKEDGMGAAITGGMDYFSEVCEKMVEVLKDC